MKYVVSDVHGNLDNWNSILTQINFKDDDELYVLGDVIDRHPYGIEIIKQIMSMPNVHMILGNHEYMMLDSLNHPYDDTNNIMTAKEQREKMELWWMNGGLITYQAYTNLYEHEQIAIINFLKSLPLNVNVEADNKVYRLCHATIEEMYDLIDFKEPESKSSFCVWDRETIELLTSLEGVTVVFGHTPTAHFQADKNPLEIFKAGSIIGIDCGSGWPKYSEDFQCRGRLACLRLGDEKVFYSK